MNTLQHGPVVRVVLVIIGAITAVPLLNTVSAGTIDALYGVSDTDDATSVLLAHRGVLQGVLGAAIAVAAFRTVLIGPVAIAAIVTKTAYITLVLANPDARQQIGLTSVIFDTVAVVLLGVLAGRSVSGESPDSRRGPRRAAS